jgi:NAD(P)-dependent dehydrogenase (short-subunit alcohol dehydrogenase family)
MSDHASNPAAPATHSATDAAIDVTAPRVALVTGAGRRIGRAIALELAQHGWDIAVHYSHSAAAAEATVADIHKLGRQAIALQADLADEAQTTQLMARCAATIGQPLLLVNNASQFDYDDVNSFSYAKLQNAIQVNLAAPVLLARQLHQALKENQRGVVINLLDQKLFNPNPDYLSYTLSKAALKEATMLLAQSLAPQLRVCGVAPGLTLGSSEIDARRLQQLQAASLLGHGPSAEEIAAAVRFLVESPSMTGTVLLIDGGQHLQPSPRDFAFMTT